MDYVILLLHNNVTRTQTSSHENNPHTHDTHTDSDIDSHSHSVSDSHSVSVTVSVPLTVTVIRFPDVPISDSHCIRSDQSRIQTVVLSVVEKSLMFSQSHGSEQKSRLPLSVRVNGQLSNATNCYAPLLCTHARPRNTSHAGE